MITQLWRSSLNQVDLPNRWRNGLLQLRHEVEGCRDFPAEKSARVECDPQLLLSTSYSGRKLYWLDRHTNRAVSGLAATWTCARLADEPIRGYLKRLSDVPPGMASWRMFGGLEFNESCRPWVGEWKAFGNGQFWIPLVTCDGHRLTVCMGEPRDRSQALELLDTLLADVPSARGIPTATSRPETSPTLFEWRNNVAEVLELMRRQVLEKIVLARRITIQFDRGWDPLLIISRLRRLNQRAYIYLLQPCEGIAFVGASPERLYGRRGCEFRSEIVAGTRPRSTSPEEDRRLGAELLASEKELLEHSIVSKSIQQGLHRRVTSILADERPSLMRLASAQHLYSEIRAELHPSVDDGDLVELLHPTPALGGYPRENALNEISRLEPFSRGWYGAPIGWMQPSRGAAEFAVGIRSALLCDRDVHLYSGAGIVPGSDADREWREVDHKVQDLVSILGLSELQPVEFLRGECDVWTS